MNRADRRGLVEGLAALPRPPGFTRLQLQVTASQINSDRDAEHMALRVDRGNSLTGSADCEHELDLMLEVAGCHRKGNRTAAEYDGIGRLLKEERRLTFVASHFQNVLAIIAPHAINAPHRKSFCIARYRHACARRDFKREFLTRATCSINHRRAFP